VYGDVALSFIIGNQGPHTSNGVRLIARLPGARARAWWCRSSANWAVFRPALRWLCH
jgi:hypothetical protein